MTKELAIRIIAGEVLGTTEQTHESVKMAVKALSMSDVPDRKVGKWELGYCSECRYNWGKDAPIANVPNFCPHCGAQMDERSEDGEIHNC